MLISAPIVLFGQGRNKTVYDVDGKISASYLVSDHGNYTFTKFHSNGLKASTGKFKDGEKHGVWKTWNATGKLTSVAHYKKGEKSGTWIIINDDEQTVFEISFQKNHMLYALKKDEHGHIIAKR